MAKLVSIGCGIVVMLGILSGAGNRSALAQGTPEAPKATSHDRPSFEVASVRRAPKDPNLLRDDPRLPRALSSGRFDAEARLRVLINWAYKPEFPFEGSFRELDEVFAIAAKAPGPVLLTGHHEVGPMNQMLQSLLEERFKLRVRWERRSFPVYALRRTTTERLGPNLKRIDTTCPPGYPEFVSAAPNGCAPVFRTNGGRVTGVAPSMKDVARFFGMFAGRRVVDDTALVGPFELSTAFDPRSEGFGPLLAQEHLPSLRDALRHDLGLRLEPDRRAFPVLIIEHVEQPTEN